MSLSMVITQGCLTNMTPDTSATIEQERLRKENQVLEQPKQHSANSNNQLLLMLPVAVRIPILLQRNFGEGKLI